MLAKVVAPGHTLLGVGRSGTRGPSDSDADDLVIRSSAHVRSMYGLPSDGDTLSGLFAQPECFRGELGAFLDESEYREVLAYSTFSTRVGGLNILAARRPNCFSGLYLDPANRCVVVLVKVTSAEEAAQATMDATAATGDPSRTTFARRPRSVGNLERLCHSVEAVFESELEAMSVVVDVVLNAVRVTAHDPDTTAQAARELLPSLKAVVSPRPDRDRYLRSGDFSADVVVDRPGIVRRAEARRPVGSAAALLSHADVP